MADEILKTDIKGMLPRELEEYLRALGQPAYRAKQVFSWLQKGCGSFEEMSNLPAALRRTLSERR